MPETEKQEYSNILKKQNAYQNIYPVELLQLFKKYAPHTLTQNEARLIFKELTPYLTEDEEHKLFVSWEHLHIENTDDGFYGIIHDLVEKFSNIKNTGGN